MDIYDIREELYKRFFELYDQMTHDDQLEVLSMMSEV